MLKQILTSAALTTALVAGSAFAGGPDMPQAPECEHCFRPFVGVYYSYLNVNPGSAFASIESGAGVLGSILGFPAGAVSVTGFTGNISDDFNGLGFLWGAKYGPYFGFAMSMNHYFQETSNITFATVTTPVAGVPTTFTGAVLGVNVQADMYNAEARGYFPLMEGFDLIGAVGGSLLDFSTSFTFPSSFITAGAVGTTTTNSFSRGTQLSWRLGAGFDYYFTPNWGIEAMFHYMPLSGTRPFVNDYWTVDAGIDYMFS